MDWLEQIWIWLNQPNHHWVFNIAGIAGVLSLVWAIYTHFSKRKSRKSSSTDIKVSQEKRNRHRMLEKVRNFWIDGVLNQSLYHVARLELGLVERPDAIEHPWKLVVQQPERAPRPLPDGMPMHAVFEQFDKTLLLLGAPGSGKTTLLLELARDLIEHAEKDPDHPIPVVFNLSSWALRRPSIMEWLIDELNERYDVPRKIGQNWVDNQQVLPLLDGLDEVAGEYRAACVEAINAFREQYGLLPLVVCSRMADYEALTVRLRLLGAVTIQPLTQEQIEVHLEQGGKSLERVRTLLDQDSTLWELLDTPLMLSIMRLAFHRNWGGVEILDAGTLEERRGQLFDAYIGAMFKRRETTSPYAPQKIRHWLIWLACAMVYHNQTIFYLEQMQPDWLPKTHSRIQAIGSKLVVGLVFGLVVGLGVGLVSGLFDWLPGMFDGLVSGLVFGLGVGLVVGLEKGGYACIQHGILRVLLWRNDYAPLNYVRFLNEAVERVFLRRIGGGYIFVHRLLMEHFAGLVQKPEIPPPA